MERTCSVLPSVFCLILTAACQGSLYSPHFTDGETEAQQEISTAKMFKLSVCVQSSDFKPPLPPKKMGAVAQWES